MCRSGWTDRPLPVFPDGKGVTVRTDKSYEYTVVDKYDLVTIYETVGCIIEKRRQSECRKYGSQVTHRGSGAYSELPVIHGKMIPDKLEIR